MPLTFGVNGISLNRSTLSRLKPCPAFAGEYRNLFYYDVCSIHTYVTGHLIQRCQILNNP